MEIKKKKLHITNLAVITLLDGGKFVVLFVVVVVAFFIIFSSNHFFSLVCSHFDLSHLEQFFTRNRYNTKHIE